MRSSSVIWGSVLLIIALVGMVDSASGHDWDHFVLFAASAVIHLAVLATTGGGRVQVSLRPDLARWVAQRSRRTGESVNDVIDRATASYQHGLYKPETLDEDHRTVR